MNGPNPSLGPDDPTNDPALGGAKAVIATTCPHCLKAWSWSGPVDQATNANWACPACAPSNAVTEAERVHTTLWNALRKAKQLLVWLGQDATAVGRAETDSIDEALKLTPAASGAYTVVLSSELERLRAESAQWNTFNSRVDSVAALARDVPIHVEPSPYTTIRHEELTELRAVRARYQDLLDSDGQGSLKWWFARCNAKSLAIKDLQIALGAAAHALDSAGRELEAQSAYSAQTRAKEALLGDAPSP